MKCHVRIVSRPIKIASITYIDQNNGRLIQQNWLFIYHHSKGSILIVRLANPVLMWEDKRTKTQWLITEFVLLSLHFRQQSVYYSFVLNKLIKTLFKYYGPVYKLIPHPHPPSHNPINEWAKVKGQALPLRSSACPLISEYESCSTLILQ